MARPPIPLPPLGVSFVLKDKVYNALRDAIAEMDIYTESEPPRLDERSLAERLGVSRTPVREALSRLEQEGLVRTIPRRGAFVVRKSKEEILEMINVWAALESMAARLVTENASDEELRELHTFLDTYNNYCTVYSKRFKTCRHCSRLRIRHALFARWLPPDCGYVKKFRNQ